MERGGFLELEPCSVYRSQSKDDFSWVITYLPLDAGAYAYNHRRVTFESGSRLPYIVQTGLFVPAGLEV